MSSSATVTRPAYRPYAVRVVDVSRLSPSFLRVTFSGDDLQHFGTAGLDQRVKILLPGADGALSRVGQDDDDVLAAGSWYQAWRELPIASRSPMRTYTVRRIDPPARRLVVDFVTHHDPGPAGAWAESARLEDELVIIGPDERSPDSRSGIDWHPGTARRALLVGDETAVPAIGGILDAIGDRIDVDVFLEVPHAADALSWSTAPSHRVRWLAREGAPHGERLIDAVRGWCASSGELLDKARAPRPQQVEDVDVDVEMIWDSPDDADGDFYAWMAGESATVKTLRRLLVTENGVDRKRVAFMGYWRLGQAERQE